MLRDSYGINLEDLTVKNIKEADASAPAPLVLR